MGQLRKDNSSIKLPSQIILHVSKIIFFFLNIMLLCNYFYLFMCVCVWPHRWKLYVCRCPRQPKESSRTLGTETIGDCELPNTRMRSKRSWSLSHVSKSCCKLTLETNHQPSYWLKKKKEENIFATFIYLVGGGLFHAFMWRSENNLCPTALSIMWVPRIKPRPSGLVDNVFNCWTILLTLTDFYYWYTWKWENDIESYFQNSAMRISKTP